MSPMSKHVEKDDVRQPQRIKDTSSFRSKSKVADMRMRFDGGASFAGTVLPGSASKDAGPRIVSPVKEGETSAIIPVPPPAPPPPIFSSPIRKKSVPNPDTTQHLPPLPIQKQKQMSPKSSEFTSSPRKNVLSETIMQRVSVLPLESTEKIAIQRRQQTSTPMNDSPVTPKPEKSALQTWPRSGIKKPKQVRNGLIAEKMRLFEDISRKKNDESIVPSPGKEKQGGESGKRTLVMDSGKMRMRTKTLIEGRKEKFEISPRRDGDEDGEPRKGRINPVFPMAIVANDDWKGKGKGKDKGKGKEGLVKDKCEDAGIQIVEVSSPPPPTKPRERLGSRGLRVGSRGRVVGQWNEFSPAGGGDGDALAHLPLKRGLRDARMHTGRDGSRSIDWDEVERELGEKGEWRDEDLDRLVGWGEKDKRIDGLRGGKGISVSVRVRGKEAGGKMGKGGDGRDESEKRDIMVVKEAECGLSEPKPLRAVEMKRMVEICRDRERVGERERSRGRKLERRK